MSIENKISERIIKVVKEQQAEGKKQAEIADYLNELKVFRPEDNKAWTQPLLSKWMVKKGYRQKAEYSRNSSEIGNENTAENFPENLPVPAELEKNTIDLSQFEVQEVSFHRGTITALKNKNDGQEYFIPKKLCEMMDVDWSGQLQRIKRDDELNTCMGKVTIQHLTGAKETIIFPVKKLSIFLYGIRPDMCKNPEVKEMLTDFKNKVEDILHTVFRKKEIVIPEIPEYSEEDLLEMAWKAKREARLNREEADRLRGEKDVLNIANKRLEKQLIAAGSNSKILKQFLDKYKDKLFTVREMSDEFNIPNLGRDNLFKVLREQGIFFYSEGTNFPKQNLKDRGYFVSIQRTFQKPDGSLGMKSQPKATVKGLCYVARLLEKLGYMDNKKVGNLKEKFFGQENRNLMFDFENIPENKEAKQ